MSPEALPRQEEERDTEAPRCRSELRRGNGRPLRRLPGGVTHDESSDVDWTIVYATKLTNGARVEPRVVPENEKVGMSQTISRADVASFLLQAATQDLYSRSSVVITGTR